MRLYNQDSCTPIGTSSTWRPRLPPSFYVSRVNGTETKVKSHKTPLSSSPRYCSSPTSNDSSETQRTEDPYRKQRKVVPNSPSQHEPKYSSAMQNPWGKDRQKSKIALQGRTFQDARTDSGSPSSNISRQSVGLRESPSSARSLRNAGPVCSPTSNTSAGSRLRTPRPAFPCEKLPSPVNHVSSPSPSQQVGINSQASNPTTVRSDELYRDMACYLFPSRGFRADIDQPISRSKDNDDGMSSSTISTHSTFLKALQNIPGAGGSVPCGIRSPFPAQFAPTQIQESRSPKSSVQATEPIPFFVLESRSGRMIGISAKTVLPLQPKTANHVAKNHERGTKPNIRTMQLQRPKASTRLFDLESLTQAPNDFYDGLSRFRDQAKVFPPPHDSSPYERHEYSHKVKPQALVASKVDTKSSRRKNRVSATKLQSVGSLNVRMQELNQTFSPHSFGLDAKRSSISASTRKEKSRIGAKQQGPVFFPKVSRGSSRKQKPLEGPSLPSMGSLNFRMQELSHEIPARFGPGNWGQTECAKVHNQHGRGKKQQLSGFRGPSSQVFAGDVSSSSTTMHGSVTSAITVFEDNTSEETPSSKKFNKVGQTQNMMGTANPDLRRYSAMFASGWTANNVKEAMVYDSVDPTSFNLIDHASQGEMSV
jgi:hypothetical protein